jgi:excisionase family DNA binding protein
MTSNNRSLKIESEEKLEWLTSQEAADHLRINKKRLLNLTSYGRVPYFKFGRTNRYLRQELDRLLLDKPKGVRK